MIKLSILTMTTPRRRNNCVQRLLDDLEKQVEGKPVEILALYDNKKRSVGAKRNAILQMAQGEYVVFIDDDDSVAPTYVADILATLEANPSADVVVFDCITSIFENGKIKEQHYSKYSKDFEYNLDNRVDANGYKQWRGRVPHTAVWRSSIAKAHIFPDISMTEDTNWCIRASKDIKVEVAIPKVLYFYAFNPSISETRG